MWQPPSMCVIASCDARVMSVCVIASSDAHVMSLCVIANCDAHVMSVIASSDAPGLCTDAHEYGGSTSGGHHQCSSITGQVSHSRLSAGQQGG